MSDQPVRRHPRQPRQGAISSVISWTNNTFNPTHSTANAARLAAVLGAYYLYKKKNEWEEEIEASSFLSEVPEQRSTVAYPPEAKQGIYRHFRAPLYPDPLPTIPFPGIDTLYSNFQRSVRLFPKRNCLGTMVEKTKDGKKVLEYEWVNYREVAERATRFGSGLVGRLGLKTGSFVGMMMLNRTEWVVCEQGCNAYNLVTVPLYDTLGAGVVEYITNEVGMEVIVCSGTTLPKILAAAPKCESLKYVVCVDDIDNGLIEDAKKVGLTLWSLQELDTHGQQHPLPHRPPKTQDLATLCYTSGTTGNPKGAMITHANFLAGHASLQMSLGSFVLDENDVHLSYLPLAHVFERFLQVIFLGKGASVGFYRGDPLLLLEDISILKPTLFASVPRIFNRIYDKTMATITASPLKKALFDMAFANKLQNFQNNGSVVHPFWDGLIFGKVREKLGGRVRALITGSAPISTDVLNFLRICFSCHVLEGYGQTEGCSMGVLGLRGDTTGGCIGPPAACCEIKLLDVPEMNYLTSDQPNPRGELCVRGPNVFVGYYKQQKKTEETLDAEGWLHSGDIAAVLPNGSFKIIDRKKNIFKLSQGEYIAPEKIEQEIQKVNWVGQIYVHGNSLQSFLVAVVVPDEEVLMEWAKTQPNLAKSSFAELCNKPAVMTMIYEAVFAQCKASKLQGFEIPKAIALKSEMFSMDNGLLTPTMKLKRNVAGKHFEKEIEHMYDKVLGKSEKAKL
mmetsp:Transcript_37100/g.58393  ORF Transcript_37100/g.58393 Transcript_37100/m.58393 type:complete len:733 (-) Transcript_37100:39-2237(-)